MKLSDYLRQDLVEPDLRAAGKTECLKKMVALLARAGVVRGEEDSLARLLEREKVVSTGIGHGVAIPHAKAAHVQQMVIVAARVAQGVDFEALDGQPVYILFLLLGPQEAASLHVRLLARIARLIKVEGFIEQLKKTESAEALYRAIREEDERHP